MPNGGATSVYLSTAEIHAKLGRISDSGRVSVRTVLRAMERLLDAGVIESEKRGVSFYWRKKAGAGGIHLGAMMTQDEALALQTLKRFSSRQIPTLVAESLSGMFDVAQIRLDTAIDERGKRYRKWIDKVEVSGGGFILIPPRIEPVIFSAVSQALFHERKLEVVYRARSNVNKTEPRILMPLGLVEVGGLVYLVAGVEKHEKPAMYRLDRLTSATMLDEGFVYPRAFHLAEYVKIQRQFDFMVEGEIHLKLRFYHGAGEHLLETPMSSDQKTRRIENWLDVEGTVHLSQRLTWWLRAFGSNVEVLKPTSLRTKMKQDAMSLLKNYNN